MDAQPDWANKDFYKVLGVDKDADAAAIKKAYRKLARENHPDSHPGDAAAEERFKAIAEAYDVVGDSEKRKAYDELRNMVASGVGGFPAGGFAGEGFAGDGFDLSDLLGGFFGGGGGRATRRPVRGADLESSTTLDFTDAIDGTTLSLSLSSETVCHVCNGSGGKPGTQPHACPTCNGAGVVAVSTGMGGGFVMNETCPSCRGRRMVYDEACPNCHGSGRGTSTRTVQARIPAGVKDGQRIRLKGKGAPGENGGPAGDLYISVHVRPHRIFGRSGDNLTLTAPLTFDEAVLGGEIKVPTLGGPAVTLRIPPGTPNGRTLRVKGKGAPKRGGGRGDLLVTVSILVPESVSGAAREAVEAYRAATEGADARASLFEGVSG